MESPSSTNEAWVHRWKAKLPDKLRARIAVAADVDR